MAWNHRHSIIKRGLWRIKSELSLEDCEWVRKSRKMVQRHEEAKHWHFEDCKQISILLNLRLCRWMRQEGLVGVHQMCPTKFDLTLRANSALEGFFKWENNNVTRKFDISTGKCLIIMSNLTWVTEAHDFLLKSTPPPGFLVFKMAKTSTEC